MRIALIGSNGQLGSELQALLREQSDVVPLTHQDIRIEDLDQSRKVLGEIKPDIIINTAAYHHVPRCEENPDISFSVNGLGAWNLARISDHLKCKLVHYSTDYVFDGSKGSPYVEEDRTNPLNVYAITKVAGENFIQNYCEKYFILRVSGIYGKVPCRAKGGNFILTMIRAARERDVVRVVDDEFLTPTSVEEIARNTRTLMLTDAFGLFHMTCQGACSWFEFAREIFRILKMKTPLQPCKASEFPSPVKRPLYSVLENKKLKGHQMDHFVSWQEALQVFLDKEFLLNPDTGLT
jgi:dTDP-4-dehydrorhamnose reductase